MSGISSPQGSSPSTNQEANVELNQYYENTNNDLVNSNIPNIWRHSNNIQVSQTLTTNPIEVRSYLRELSVVLASQAISSDETSEKENLELESMSIISNEEEKERHLVGNTSKDRTGEATKYGQAFTSITDAVFSQLEPIRYNYKKRKVSSFIIKDIEQKVSLITSDSPKPNTIDNNIPELFYTGHNMSDDSSTSIHSRSDDVTNEFQQELYIDKLNSDHIPILKKFMTENRMKEISIRELDDLIEENEEQEQIQSSLYQAKGLQPLQLRHMIRPYLLQDDILLVQSSWKYLQKLSGKLIDHITADLRDDYGKITLDRQHIIWLFERYNIINQSATNEELFELCRRYLPLEDLNELEIALFG